MNAKIKFSHRYDKIPADTILNMGTVLLHVFTIEAKDIGFDFLNYDTIYCEDGKVNRYELPKGKVLVLLLLSGGLMLWTTIRRWIPQKEKYYQNIVGQPVEIVINENTA